MGRNFFEEIQPNLIKRLESIYNCDREYKQALENEIGLSKQLEDELSERQLQAVKNYQDAICRTWGICEMMAYKQGMRDLAAILGIESKGE